jgi:hypothetical protein
MATAGDVVDEDLGRMNRPFGRVAQMDLASVGGRKDSVGALQPGESRPWVVDTRAESGISTSRNLTVGPRRKAR